MAAVEGKVPVFVDGGVRRGVDLIKARALGAQSVLVGRATLFGAVAAGEDGAVHALKIVADEFVRAMKLCGMNRSEDISRDLIIGDSAAHAAGSAISTGKWMR